MSKEARKFIQILEEREDWGFKKYGSDMLYKADKCAKAIIEDVHAASMVPVKTWVLFIALLPFQQSLDALSDLSLVLPRVLKEIVFLDQITQDETILLSRHTVLERLNILVRRELHSSVLTAARKQAINLALGQIHGHYK